MKSKIVPVKNIQRLSQAAEMLTNRAIGVPGIGIVDGETGAGKTTANAWLVNQVDGIYIRAKALWGAGRSGPGGMLRAILHELDIEPRGNSDRMLEDLVQALSSAKRPLFIDEADHLVRKEAIVETVRDIHDLSRQPVILIGYTGLDRKLAQYRQFTRRILQHVRFQPADFEDAQLMARSLCEVTIADDLLQRIHEKAQGSIGELTVGLANVEAYARNRNLAKISSADYGKKDDFFIGGAVATAAAGGNVTQIGAAR